MVQQSSGAKSAKRTKERAGQARKRVRGTGGIVAIRDGVWRVDIEVKRDPVTLPSRMFLSATDGPGVTRVYAPTPAITTPPTRLSPCLLALARGAG